MIPIQQTQFGHDFERSDVGNCFSACVASVLEIPLEDIPNFCYSPREEKDDWFDRFQKWLNHLSFCAITICNFPKDLLANLGYIIASIKSPRGDFLHSVVIKNGLIVWDPYPGWRLKLDCEDTEKACFFIQGSIEPKIHDIIILVPLDPAIISRSTKYGA